MELYGVLSTKVALWLIIPDLNLVRRKLSLEKTGADTVCLNHQHIIDCFCPASRFGVPFLVQLRKALTTVNNYQRQRHLSKSSFDSVVCFCSIIMTHMDSMMEGISIVMNTAGLPTCWTFGVHLGKDVTC